MPAFWTAALVATLVVASQPQCPAHEDYTIRKNGQTLFTVAQNGSCYCSDFVGSVAKAKNLTDNPEFTSLVAEVADLWAQLAELRAAMRTGLAGAFCWTDVDCLAQANLTCSTKQHRCVYKRGTTCPDATGVFCQPCTDGLPSLSVLPFLHLDACQRSAFVLNGTTSAVKSVNVSGVSRRSLVGSDSSPIWRPNVINGLPALLFDGLASHLLGPVDVPAHGSVSTFAVVQPFVRQSEAPNEIMSIVDIIVGDVNSSHLLEIDKRGPRYLFRNPAGTGGGDTLTSATRNLTMNATNLQVGVRSQLDGRQYVRLNGFEAGSTNLTCPPFEAFASTALIGILKSGTLARPVYGHIAEIIVYFGDLSASDVVAVETYLRSKDAV
eukprot:TRINITY_DN5768_c0_g1_i2.p1 TRINITY_DN5768_c0_g1~~TRINITY_DN5768_c0_g1_i2.p1  ORF type:complete len:380 (-),score=137.96 TRINITY_DN5768_c0_g1_i2:82-1221(-)